MAVAAALLKSDRQDWNTPAEVLDLVRQVGPIGLDPCWNAAGLVRAARNLDGAIGCSGLLAPWGGHGLVFINPPYGRELVPWAKKIAAEGAAGVEAIALVPARTDTAWWHDHIATADAICFWRGRLTFLGAEAGAPFPSALAYFGERAKRFATVFGPRGWVVRK
jgi:hypothetical protein